MVTFVGTDGDDSILRTSISAGVGIFPDAVAGTLTGEVNSIHGQGGNDVLAAGDGDGWGTGDEVYGDAGNDRIRGGTGQDYLYGGDGNDTILGVSGNGVGDTLYGGPGRDVLRAAEGYGNVLHGGSGADRMYGSYSDDVFVVDNSGDKVIEKSDGGGDEVVSALATMKLMANVEILSFDEAVLYEDVRFSGNSLDNSIYTAFGDDRVWGGAGDGYIETGDGADAAWGGSGNDVLLYFEGSSRLYGGAGDDYLYGGAAADRLYGGRGADIFDFDEVSHSTPTRRDIIGSTKGSAFDGAGKAEGDVIDLRDLDGDLTVSYFQPLVFGGTGKGHLSLADEGSCTLVRANLDDDGGFEFQILIEDGKVRASAYTADDFLLA